MIRWKDDLQMQPQESAGHDLLRLFLVAQVVLGHVAALTLAQMPALMAEPFTNAVAIGLKLATRYGPQAAYLFVFLSGYMVAGPLIRQAVGEGAPPSFRRFAENRLKRLLPGVFFALVITACFDGAALFVLDLGAAYQNLMSLRPADTYTLPIFVGNMLFLEPTFVPAFGSNGPLWTLGYIVQYYLAGFALLRLARLHVLAAGLAGALLLAAAAMLRSEWGILFAVWLAGGIARNFGTPSRIPFALVAAFLCFLLSNLLPPLISAAASAPIGILFVAGLREAHGNRLGANAGLTRSAARHTYLIYAVHFPIAVFFAALFRTGGVSGFGIVLIATALCIVLITGGQMLLLPVSASRRRPMI